MFAKEFAVFVPNAISHHGRPSRLALIRFNARRQDNLASLLVPHNLRVVDQSSEGVRTTPNLLRCLAILIGRRSFGGFDYFSVSLINFNEKGRRSRSELSQVGVHQPPRRFGAILTKYYSGIRTKPNGKVNQRASALIRTGTGVFVFVRTTI